MKTRKDLLAVILLVFVMVLFLIVPAIRSEKDKAQRIRCVGRLKNIGLSFRIFATDNQNRFPWQSGVTNGTFSFTNRGDAFQHFMIISNELNTPLIAACPADRERKAVDSFGNFTDLNVSYFVGLSATENLPENLLAGDRNILIDGAERPAEQVNLLGKTNLEWSTKIHKQRGNVAMGDGSVQQADSTRLRGYNGTDGVTNILLFP